MERPHTLEYIRMIIGIFGLYIKLITLHDLELQPWGRIIKKQP